MPKLTTQEVEIVNNVTSAASALSLCGSVFVIGVFLALPGLRRFPFALVFIMAVNDVFTMIAGLSAPPASELSNMALTKTVSVRCFIQATSITFFRIASILWTCAIALVIYLSVVQRKPLENHPWKVAFISCAIIYAIAAVLAGIPYFFPDTPIYGSAGGWCWVNSSVSNAPAWRIGLLYAWVWLGWLWNVVIVLLVRISLRRLLAQSKVASSSKLGKGARRGSIADAPSAGTDGSVSAAFVERVSSSVRRTQWYPIILVGVWFFATFRTIYESVNGADDQHLWMYIAHRSTSSLQGLFNALVYGYSARAAVWARLPAPVKRACLCCCSRGSDTERTAAASLGVLDSGALNAEEVLRGTAASAEGVGGKGKRGRRKSGVTHELENALAESTVASSVPGVKATYTVPSRGASVASASSPSSASLQLVPPSLGGRMWGMLGGGRPSGSGLFPHSFADGRVGRSVVVNPLNAAERERGIAGVSASGSGSGSGSTDSARQDSGLQLTDWPAGSRKSDSSGGGSTVASDPLSTGSAMTGSSAGAGGAPRLSRADRVAKATLPLSMSELPLPGELAGHAVGSFGLAGGNGSTASLGGPAGTRGASFDRTATSGLHSGLGGRYASDAFGTCIDEGDGEGSDGDGSDSGGRDEDDDDVDAVSLPQSSHAHTLMPTRGFGMNPTSGFRGAGGGVAGSGGVAGRHQDHHTVFAEDNRSRLSVVIADSQLQFLRSAGGGGSATAAARPLSTDRHPSS